MNEPEKPSRLPKQLQAFRHHDYRLYFAGLAISFTGTWLQQIAQGWLVLTLTNSALLLGVVASIGSLPVLLFSLIAGVAADRMNKRRLLLITQSGAMILAFALAALTYYKVVNVYHIMAIGFLLGVVNAFDWPTRQAFVIKIVGREDLVNAIALNSATFNGARILGPSFAGLAIAVIGTAGAFFVNGLSFIAVIVALLLMHVREEVSVPEESPLQSMREGLAFVRGHAVVISLLVAAGAVSIFAMPYAVIMPVFARDILHVGPGGLGYLMSAVGVGAIGGVITLSSLGDFSGKGRLLHAGNATFCAALFAFSFSQSMLLSLALLVVAGWGMMINMALMNTLIQTLSPDELRGRVLSVYTIMVMGLSPIGSLQIGAVSHWFGVGWAVRISVFACAVVMAIAGRWFSKA